MPANLARVGGRMGGCLALLISILFSIICNTGRAGQYCPGGWPNGMMLGIANY